MKHYALGLFTAYSFLLTCYAAGLHNGKIASISQACVERTTVAPADFVAELQRGVR
jgi:hypothetical protein